MKGLVLEGGGTKGAYQLGAYKALKELGMEFDGIVGTSIGALNAAFIIQGDYDIMEDIWLNQDYKSFMIIEEDLYEKYKNTNKLKSGKDDFDKFLEETSIIKK